MSTKYVIDWIYKRARCAPATGFVACLVGLAGCANNTALTPPPADMPTAKNAGLTYTLTEKDKALDCATMRGRMQIALLQLKSEQGQSSGSLIARGMQGSLTQVFGGPSYATNPDADRAREASRLRAYNQWLKDQDCKSYDLDQELAPASSHS